MTPDDWQVIRFTALMSATSTAVLLPPGLLVAWLLARFEWRGKVLVETLVSLPLVLPPVATGLILLKLLGRKGPIGMFLQSTLGIEIVFTWRAVIIALGVMSFPLLVRSARIAFEQVPRRLEQIAATLGAHPWRVFFRVTLPLALPGVLGGCLLAFARALGEFGATILLAGNIPGQTTTLSMAIFQHVQLGEDSQATTLLTVAGLLSFAAVWASETLSRRHAIQQST